MLLFLAIMPQFISPTAPWPLSLQTTALGGIHIVATMLFYTVLALTAVHVLARHPRITRPLSIVSGLLMVLIGLALVAEQAWPLLS